MKMDTKNSLVLLLLEMFLEVSASYSVSGLYRGVWYQPVEHHALLGQSFMTRASLPSDVQFGVSAIMDNFLSTTITSIKSVR